jgi:predicted PurR-regulated permease PerM
VLGLIAIGCLAILSPFFSAILWAVVVVIATWPLLQRIKRGFNGRVTPAAILLTFLLSTVVILPLLLVVLSTDEEVTRVAGLVRGLLAEGLPPPPSWLAGVPVLGPALLERWQQLLLDPAEAAVAVRQALQQGRLWLLQAGVSAGTALLNVILSLLIVFVLYLNGESIIGHLRSGVQRLAAGRAERLLRVAHRTMAGVIYGVLGTSLIQAGLIGMGMWVAGVPGVVVLSVLLFFLSLVPVAPLLIVAIAVGWLFAQGAVAAGIGLLVWSVAVAVLTDSVLKPYLVSRTGGTLPLVLILLGMLGGVSMFGLLGLFIGPTLLAVGFTLVTEWSAGEGGERVEPASAEAAAGGGVPADRPADGPAGGLASGVGLQGGHGMERRPAAVAVE